MITLRSYYPRWLMARTGKWTARNGNFCDSQGGHVARVQITDMDSGVVYGRACLRHAPAILGRLMHWHPGRPLTCSVLPRSQGHGGGCR